MIDPRAFVRDKRDGRTHAPEQVAAFIAGFHAGAVSDDQVAAWLMAAFLNGLDEAETDALTRALLDSGRTFDWRDLGRPSADKHSTGGVGDKISLALAPLVAACGVLVPMVSGRGLGHTGGTLDKLESIPGFRTRLDPEAMRSQLDRLGVVMVGQGPDLAPADGMLYALRDVTSTVEREYFIVPSIVSKKVAEGADAIVYDVKAGSGAFMKTRDDAAALGRRLVRTTRALGRKARAHVTDMSQPLGVAVGNALEVREAAAVLQGGGPADVRQLTVALAASMLELSGGAPADAALARVHDALASGRAWQRFLALVEAQGGDPRAVERDDGLARAPVVRTVAAPRAGIVQAIDTFALGDVVVGLGGGRRAKEDAIDPAVGLEIRARIGDRLAAGDPLAVAHLRSDDPERLERVAASFSLGDGEAPPPALMIERID